jgi:hypothetical protein
MEYTEPKNLYTIDEFRLRLEHTIENIKGVLNEWVIENEYEFTVLRSDSFKGGFTPRQFANMIGELYEIFHNLTNKEYSDWSQEIGGNIYEIMDKEIDKLREEDELAYFSAVELVEHLMNIVKENLHEGEGSMIHCLIKV